MAAPDGLAPWLLRLGDNALILGQRLSQWCGHGPVLEEDIALANTALDLIGQAQLWLALAGEVEGKGRSADDLAFLRDAWEFHNALLVEQPNGDFGQTIMRQFLFDAWHVEMLGDLANSRDDRVAAIAAKAVKEARYHLERSQALVIGLGDGTEESHGRMQAALDILWPFVGELTTPDALDQTMAEAGLAPDLGVLAPLYTERVRATLAEATLSPPGTSFAHQGGKTGQRHSEHLGHLLSQMQWLQRAYPGATW